MLIQEPESTPEVVLGMDTFEKDESTVIECVEETVLGGINWVSCIDDGDYSKQAIVELLANSEDALKLITNKSSCPRI